MEKVVDKYIRELNIQLAEKNIQVELTPNARTTLAKRGYEPRFGARALSRIVQEEIKDDLADKILSGEFSKGDKVRIGCRKGEFYFHVPEK
jgi:ATP-dependent Clp protease ATP-binding subunit ClpA